MGVEHYMEGVLRLTVVAAPKSPLKPGVIVPA
jgi:hypothetical protein